LEQDAEEEEAMQRAIEASLFEKNPKPRDLLPAEPVAEVSQNIVDGGKRQESRVGRERAVPRMVGHRAGGRPGAAILGLGIDPWVDNSDFRTRSEEPSSREAPTGAANRSVSCGTRAVNGGSAGHASRSGIVSLPRIQRLPAAEQQEMVKDLHASMGIKETFSPRDELPGRTDMQTQLPGRANMQTLMADLNLEKPYNRADVGFNERFASCRSDAAVPPVSSARRPLAPALAERLARTRA
jgi:hypothetical protein